MKKVEKLFDSITDIDEQILEEVEQKRNQNVIVKFIKIEKVAILIVAILIVAILALGGTTAFAASPELRQAIINFFTGGKEEVPYEQLDTHPVEEFLDSEDDEIDTVRSMEFGDIKVIKDKSIDEHVTATYISSDKYISMEQSLGGIYFVSTQDQANDENVFYKLNTENVEVFDPVVNTKTCTMRIEKMQGLTGEKYTNLVLPEFSFDIKWQSYDDKIKILPMEENHRFDIGSTFGGTKDGKSIEGMYDGSIYARSITNEWVEVVLDIDAQTTWYSYPVLFNIETGEVEDPIANVDLSKYEHICELNIVSRGKAVAKVGKNMDNLRDIVIDLENGVVLEDEQIDIPVKKCYMSVQTSRDTVFYLIGTEESSAGYIYNQTYNSTTELFDNAAVGYNWKKGFADNYIQLIGYNYALYYDEPKNEVSLLNMVTGKMNLLQGIPASHDISYLFDSTGKSLCVDYMSESGATRIAFYNTDKENGWYIDRKISDEVQEVSAYWFDDQTYCVNAEAEGKYYLFIYEYK